MGAQYVDNKLRLARWCLSNCEHTQKKTNITYAQWQRIRPNILSFLFWFPHQCLFSPPLPRFPLQLRSRVKGSVSPVIGRESSTDEAYISVIVYQKPLNEPNGIASLRSPSVQYIRTSCQRVPSEVHTLYSPGAPFSSFFKNRFAVLVSRTLCCRL